MIIVSMTEVIFSITFKIETVKPRVVYSRKLLPMSFTEFLKQQRDYHQLLILTQLENFKEVFEEFVRKKLNFFI